MGLGRGTEQLKLAQRLLAVFDESRTERPRAAQFAQQQIDPGLLVQREVGHAGDGGIEQFRDRAFMHSGILSDVEPGQMEAEAINSTAQLPQTPPRDGNWGIPSCFIAECKKNR